MKILLLGPRESRFRIDLPGGAAVVRSAMNPADEYTVIDFDPTVGAAWPDATFYAYDLRGSFGYLLPTASFDEVHAYEVLNLLAGDEIDFFRFWRQVWDCMKVGATLTATVPHWTSQWVHAYPAPQRTYTPVLLSYLDPRDNLDHKSGFSRLWPAPYCFRVAEVTADFARQGLYFKLEKLVR